VPSLQACRHGASRNNPLEENPRLILSFKYPLAIP
jgi:hypothetical protein